MSIFDELCDAVNYVWNQPCHLSPLCYATIQTRLYVCQVHFYQMMNFKREFVKRVGSLPCLKVKTCNSDLFVAKRMLGLFVIKRRDG